MDYIIATYWWACVLVLGIAGAAGAITGIAWCTAQALKPIKVNTRRYKK